MSVAALHNVHQSVTSLHNDVHTPSVTSKLPPSKSPFILQSTTASADDTAHAELETDCVEYQEQKDGIVAHFSSVSSSSSASSSMSFNSDYEQTTETTDEEVLMKEGYKIERKISSGLQGDVYECSTLIEKKDSRTQKIKMELQRVAIKKTLKSLYVKRG
eukprot:361242_1